LAQREELNVHGRIKNYAWGGGDLSTENNEAKVAAQRHKKETSRAVIMAVFTRFKVSKVETL
jgi:hypothetical protein